MPVTGLHQQSPQVTQIIFFTLREAVLDAKTYSWQGHRSTNKCCNKNITKYQHKYQINSSSTSTNTSTSTSTKYDQYILLQFRCSPTLPPSLLHSASLSPHAASTLPPRSCNATAFSCHAAPTQLRAGWRRVGRVRCSRAGWEGDGMNIHTAQKGVCMVE